MRDLWKKKRLALYMRTDKKKHHTVCMECELEQAKQQAEKKRYCPTCDDHKPQKDFIKTANWKYHKECRACEEAKTQAEERAENKRYCLGCDNHKPLKDFIKAENRKYHKKCRTCEEESKNQKDAATRFCPKCKKDKLPKDFCKVDRKCHTWCIGCENRYYK